jgi:AraC-like DNA-binding protein
MTALTRRAGGVGAYHLCMSSAVRRGHEGPEWDIAVPPSRMGTPGVRMAAFTSRSPGETEVPIVPFPAVTLFLDLGDAVVIDEHQREVARGGGIVGMGAAGLRGRARSLDCLQIRLTPSTAYAILGGGLSELADGAVDLDAVWGRHAERLRSQLQEKHNWADRFAILDAALGRMRNPEQRLGPEVAYIWRQLAITRGQTRIDYLATEIGWSRQQLWARFRSRLGITPKLAGRLLRFDEAAHRLADGQAPARVAADCGYADQSHLHRDTAAFTGLTPSGVAAAGWLQIDHVAWPREPS